MAFSTTHCPFPSEGGNGLPCPGYGGFMATSPELTGFCSPWTSMTLVVKAESGGATRADFVRATPGSPTADCLDGQDDRSVGKAFARHSNLRAAARGIATGAKRRKPCRRVAGSLDAPQQGRRLGRMAQQAACTALACSPI